MTKLFLAFSVEEPQPCAVLQESLCVPAAEQQSAMRRPSARCYLLNSSSPLRLIPNNSYNALCCWRGGRAAFPQPHDRTSLSSAPLVVSQREEEGGGSEPLGLLLCIAVCSAAPRGSGLQEGVRLREGSCVSIES